VKRRWNHIGLTWLATRRGHEQATVRQHWRVLCVPTRSRINELPNKPQEQSGGCHRGSAAEPPRAFRKHVPATVGGLRAACCSASCRSADHVRRVRSWQPFRESLQRPKRQYRTKRDIRDLDVAIFNVDAVRLSSTCDRRVNVSFAASLIYGVAVRRMSGPVT